MIFKREMVQKILAGGKTVTRRPAKPGNSLHGPDWKPCKYEVDKTYAIQPVIEEGPGKGRGGKEVGRLFVVRIDRERLGGGLDWSISEAEREGFEDWPAFREYWTKLYGAYDPTQLVDRIEFQLLSNSEEGK